MIATTVNQRALASVLFGGLFLHAYIVFAVPSPPQDPPAKITVNVNSVPVPVVVLDANGLPVRDLTKEDFKIFVKGQPQTITSFSVEQHAATPSSGKEVALSPNPNVATKPAGPAPRPERFLIYLFDDLHLEVADLPRVQTAASKLLATSLSSTDIAAVMSIAGTNSGLTSDPARRKLLSQHRLLPG